MNRVEITVARYHGYGYDCRTLINPDPAIEPVLLVGGAFQQKTGWGRLETLLAESASVVTVDLPGWGESDLLPAWRGMDFLAEALHHVVELAGHRRVHVFGGSYGGAVAFRLAQRHPELVLSLALMGTPTSVAEPLRSRLLRTVTLLREGRLDDFADYSVALLLADEPPAHSDPAVDSNPAAAANPIVHINRGAVVSRILSGIFRGISAEDAAKYMHNTMRLLEHDLHDPNPPVTVPVLLGTGEHDDFTAPRMCRSLAASCADARFTLLRDADHAVHLEVPEALADLLLRFFAGQPLDGLAGCHPIEYFGTSLVGTDRAGFEQEDAFDRETPPAPVPIPRNRPARALG
jgi:pimeloyl-ACP methyl ester carboxylesterase